MEERETDRESIWWLLHTHIRTNIPSFLVAVTRTSCCVKDFSWEVTKAPCQSGGWVVGQGQ